MRLSCPYCGERDLREFTCKGSAVYLLRPDAGSDPDEWDAYLHLRDNPAGPAKDLFHHDPCGTWIVVSRDTVTHEVSKCTAAREMAT